MPVPLCPLGVATQRHFRFLITLFWKFCFSKISVLLSTFLVINYLTAAYVYCNKLCHLCHLFLICKQDAASSMIGLSSLY